MEGVEVGRARGGRGGSRSPKGRGGKGLPVVVPKGWCFKEGGSRKGGSSKSDCSSKSKVETKEVFIEEKEKLWIDENTSENYSMFAGQIRSNQIYVVKYAVKLLGFSEQDIIKIKLRFDEIDIDQTGEIDYNEFLDDISETRSPFVDAVFSLVDVNGNGNLDFGEYIQVFLSILYL